MEKQLNQRVLQQISLLMVNDGLMIFHLVLTVTVAYQPGTMLEQIEVIYLEEVTRIQFLLIGVDSVVEQFFGGLRISEQQKLKCGQLRPRL